MRKLLIVAIALGIVASVIPPWRASAQTTRGGATRPPLVSVVEAPAGTAKLAVELPGPGDVTLGGKHLTTVSKHPAAAGEARLKVKALGKTKRKLRRRGKAAVRPKVTFTPTGGTANTLSERVELVVKRRR